MGKASACIDKDTAPLVGISVVPSVIGGSDPVSFELAASRGTDKVIKEDKFPRHSFVSRKNTSSIVDYFVFVSWFWSVALSAKLACSAPRKISVGKF